jgi:hypothetical protein
LAAAETEPPADAEQPSIRWRRVAITAAVALLAGLGIGFASIGTEEQSRKDQVSQDATQAAEAKYLQTVNDLTTTTVTRTVTGQP